MILPGNVRQCDEVYDCLSKIECHDDENSGPQNTRYPPKCGNESAKETFWVFKIVKLTKIPF